MNDIYGYQAKRNEMSALLGVGGAYIEKKYPDSVLRQMAMDGEALGSDIEPAAWEDTLCAHCGERSHLTPSEHETVAGLLNAVYYVSLLTPLTGAFGRRAGATDQQIVKVHAELEHYGAIAFERCVAARLLAQVGA